MIVAYKLLLITKPVGVTKADCFITKLNLKKCRVILADNFPKLVNNMIINERMMERVSVYWNLLELQLAEIVLEVSC